MRRITDLIFIRNNEILLVKKRGFWILPGGGNEEGENDRECLEREIREELNSGVSIGNFYKTFNGISLEGKNLKFKTYFGYTTGVMHLTPGDSVTGFEFTSKPESYNLTEWTREVINTLKEEGYLK